MRCPGAVCGAYTCLLYTSTVKNEETGKAEKMSKSRGNAIAPREVIEKLGVEGYRYYFMTDVTPGTDGAISFGRMEQVYNADLANSWGNLISRSANMCIKYFEDVYKRQPSRRWVGFALVPH